MITSYSRGHEIYFDPVMGWLYSDTKKPLNERRPCKRCGKAPTGEGHDACLGKLDNVVSACCGHGIKEPCIIRKGDL